LKIRSRHRQAIELLSDGMMIGECANAVGVSSRSIYNWLEDDEFSRLLRRRESEKIKRLNAKYIMASEKAFPVLLEALESRNESIRMRACSILRNGYYRAIEVHDLYDQIERIHEKLDQLAFRR